MGQKELRSNKKAETVRIPKTRKISGFTLVELIVVITILAILATIGFLALSGYSQDAKDSAIKANVRSLQTAISSEAAITNNSPRYYVVHDTDYALSGAFAYVDGASVALTGGDVGSAPLDSNYTAGKPDFKKLKLNPDKFRISASGLPGGTLGVLARATGFGADSAEASYDADSLMAAGADFMTAGANGKKRVTSYVQTAGVSPATRLASVAGNFPTSNVPAGNVSGLFRAEPGSATNLTGALLDGAAGSQSVPTANQNAPSVVALMHLDGRPDNGDPSRNSVVLNMRMEGSEGADTLVDDAGTTFVKTGTPSVSTGTGKYGASMYFNDSSYYMANAYSQDYSIAAGDFTVEAWIYNTIPASGQTNSYYTIAGTSNWIFYMNQSSVLSWTSQSVGTATGPTIPKNVWTHVAAVRSGTTVTIYVNGVASWSATVNNGWTNATAFYVGTDPAGLTGREFRGYIDDLRITKGVARYSGTFTPAQIPEISGQTFADEKWNAVTVNGKPTPSSAQSKFGGYSAAFNGTTDSVKLTSASNFNFGTGNVTIEWWYYVTDAGNTYKRLFQNASGGTPAGKLYVYAYANKIKIYDDARTLADVWTFPVGQWFHLAMVKDAGTVTFFVNGVAGTGHSSPTTAINSTEFTIGWWPTEFLWGYADEFRITKWALYTTDFTPATTAFPNN